MKAQTLKVPGATLYYETRGSGLVLLLIAGGGTECSVLLKNRKGGEIYALVTIYCRYQWHARDDF